MIKVKRADGTPFRPGDMVGVTVSSPSPASPDVVVRVPIDAGGRTELSVLRVSGSIPTVQLSDPFEVTSEPQRNEEGALGRPGTAPLRAIPPKPVGAKRPWHADGAYGYHAHHTAARAGAWAVVVDGSASLLAAGRRDHVGRLLEVVIGMGIAARAGAPHSVLVCGEPRAREISLSLDADVVDWRAALGDTPAPWSQVVPAVRQAAGQVGPQGLVLVVCDGPPVDSTELVTWSGASDSPQVGLCVLGRSARFAHDRNQSPRHWWDEELLVLEPLTSSGRHTVAAIADPEGAPESAAALADALFPG